MAKSTILAGLLLSLATGAAQANDSWSGFYVGLDGGVAQTTAKAYSFLGAANGKSQDLGGIVGISAGYDRQFGDFVGGGVVDISYVGTEDLYFGGKTDISNYDLDAIATARVRGGFAVNQQLLVYGTGGFALSFIDATLIDPLPSTRAGYVVGFGSELKINENWSVKTEFLHHKFDDYVSENAATVSVLKSNAASSIDENILKSSLNTLKIGLNYRF